jgi:NAD(P)-dependent dehydrogenase (short-subunit alcohol dehydrogenase family)
VAWAGVDGKRVLITGATNGIGLAAARELARRGARLAIVGRNPARAQAAAASIGEGVDVLLADLSLMSSVRGLAQEALDRYERIDVLVNNAGGMNVSRRITSDGIELTWAVNHLAPFLLTTLLLDRLRASAPARVITTSSAAHEGARLPFDDLAGEKAYGPFGFGRYGQTKLANILFTLELALRLRGSGVEAFCFHPGFVASGFNHNNGPLMSFGMGLVRPFARTPEKGAETLVWLADSAEVDGQSGGYFFDCRPSTPSAAARDAEAAARLWEVSEEQVRAYSSHDPPR